MRRQVNLIQGTPEWHAWRSGKIGASDVAALMGKSIHKTPLQLWSEKVGETVTESTFAMRRGQAYEEAARRAATDITGRNFQPACFENPLYPLNIASLDGWDEGMALEIKTPKKDDHALAARRIVPPHYVPQCQAIMLVTETPEMLYASYCPIDSSIHVFIVKRDDVMCDEIAEMTKDFMEMITNRIPPDPTDADYETIEDGMGLSNRYRERAALIKQLSEEQEKDKEMILEAVERKSARFGDLKITRTVRPGNVDYKRIPELLMVDLDRYRKSPIEYFRFS